MIRVDPDWSIVDEAMLEGYLRKLHVRTTYGVTCAVADSTIRVVMDRGLPQGVEVTARFGSSIGQSQGWVPVVHACDATLVLNPRGNESNQAELWVLLPDGIGVSDVLPNVVFGF